MAVMNQRAEKRPKVIILGGGFGGLFAAKTLANRPLDVLVIDKNNYHTFTPLLYQVATSTLDPGEIAYPLRRIFSKAKNVRCLLGTATDISPAGGTITVEYAGRERTESYDYLILATGSKPSYFGMDHLSRFTYDLRTLQDAIRLRNQILHSFEQASWIEDEVERKKYTTFVVIGGGPTGLETSGALYELLNHVLDREYPGDQTLQATVYLVEKAPQLLTAYPPKLQQAAQNQLRTLGVNVILGNGVLEISEDHIQLEDQTLIPTRTVIWAAGVQGNPPFTLDGRGLAPGSKIAVAPTLESKGNERIYVVGDLAYLPDPDGQPYPMMIPVAQQQGILAAGNILRRIQASKEKAFHYRDRGVMATIGRSRAVAWIFRRLALTGFPAWLGWLLLHLVALIGFRNKLVVLISWLWNYFTYDRSVRIILD
jgi:NADH dehydrogenase